MGACATKFNVLKDAGDAPAPEPAPEVASKEVTAAELEVKNEEAVVVENDETNQQSLGHLFKDKEKEGEEVQQEDASEAKNQSEIVKSPGAVADAPIKAESEKIHATDAPKAEEVKQEEKVEDKQVVEPQKTAKLEEKKPVT